MSEPSSSVLASERPPTSQGSGGYPLVTVCIVAHNPGAWFEETLRSMLLQDYPALELVVIDADSDIAVAPRVHELIPEATVVPLLANQGFAKNANVLLDQPTLGPFVLVCHDDVALAPDCVRRLMEEATRSNAGVVGPKLLSWTDPRRILHVGMSVDKTGRVADIAEPGEYDQEQHDAVRDVFAVPGAVTLIRTDLFRALEGFDGDMLVHGEDLDLCWRAHVLGARVLINPAATARHREDLSTRIVGHERVRYARRHRIRSLLSNYSLGHLIRVAPQAFVVSMINAFLALLQGRISEIFDIFRAWLWNLANIPSIIRRRRHLKRVRRIGDNEVRALQTPGFEGVQAWRRARADDRALRVQEITDESAPVGDRRKWQQISVLVWAATLIVMLVGSRSLITDGLPMFNQFVSFPDGPSPLLAEWGTTWRGSGLGSEASSSFLHLILGFLGVALFGQMGLLRLLVTLGLILVGAVGVYRVLAPFNSIQGQLAALIIYVAAPVPWNSLHAGSWAGLAVYAAMPWIARRLAIAAGMSPFSTNDESALRRIGDIVIVGMIIALAALVAPLIVLCVVVVVGGWVVAALATSRVSHVLRLIVATIGAIAVAFALSLPGSMSLLTSDWSVWGSAATASDTHFSLDQLARMASGPHGLGLFGWFLLAPASIALIIAYGRRFTWAAGGWFGALGALALAWLGQRSGSNHVLADPQVLLGPAALGLAMAAGMTGVAVTDDLRRYRFGWRQFVPVVALVGFGVSALAGVGGMLDGRWKVVDDGWTSVFSLLDDSKTAHARILWIGDPNVLPVEGRPYEGDMAWSLTHARPPTVLDMPLAMSSDEVDELAVTLADALAGESSRVGERLGVYGIRYIALVEANAPDPFSTVIRPVDANVLERFGEQLDLVRIDVRSGVTVYENRAYLPLVASFPADSAARVTTPGGLTSSPFETALPEVKALRRYTGDANSGDIWVAFREGDNWSLRVGDNLVNRDDATGWASIYSVDEPGPAQLEHRNDLGRAVGAFINLVGWMLALVALVLGRRRR